MKTLFFILCIIINFILIFKVNNLLKPKTAAISYAISLLIVPVLMLAGVYLLRLLDFQADQQFQDIYFAVMLSLVVMMLQNLVMISAEVMTRKLFHFQETENAVNTSRNLIRFALNNKSGIKLMYRTVFFVGSILMFYGIWLGKK
ncbi:hypothetical protein [Pedobacter sp. MR22-3]|uniref:hypothetical protein n=1 Tax=Pedobacter sp. MR22-3 TaxID=2994552 RepID=UPI002246D5F6|nr:hypothetical protein [Pedobacter sp. MR22-3]MCX2585650.1 hypothetical protein [Pedobacter sp. MR22-3]